jgi:AraC-like DNA-binding protein
VIVVSQTRHMPDAPTVVRDLSAATGVDAHWHDDHQIVYASSGVLAVHTDDSRWITPAHRAIWVPAHTVHAHRAYGHTRLHLLGVATDQDPLGLDQPAVLAVTPLLRELLIAYTELDGAARAAPAGRQLLTVALDQLAVAPEPEVRVPTPRDPRLRALCSALEADPGDGRGLDAWGHQVGASARTLSRLFRQEVGMSFPQWRTQLRLYHALRLLAEGHTVSTVAQQCGFASSSAFIDVFRRNLGRTPGRHLVHTEVRP